ncbi:venom acid phosphatase Acph-1 isoform X2 [Halyomorpha halys]|uniref:venom acid phosphatase Acph-1 isoform X2 n=1 Tax=Halyomorpha halys TaxID=286706 RepID=UPI0006D51D8B|nr:venom acid phosphatase Acph-1-like isoform X2 [Halyomorpha halys]
MVVLGGRVLLLLLHIFFFVNCQSNDGNTSLLAKPTLVRLFVVLRHGSRAPNFEKIFHAINKDVDVELWPAGAGELTQNGKREAYEMGRKLRTRYSAFLGDYYNAKDFRVFSTLIERTMMTAQLAASAMFPPKGYQKWSNELAWQPVPVYPEYVISNADDVNCKWLLKDSSMEMKNKNMSASEFGLEEDDLRLLQDQLGSYDKNSILFMFKLWNVWDNNFFKAKENISLPPWTKTLYPDKMTAAVLKFGKFFLSGSPTRKMVLVGPYGKGLTSYFTKSERKMELHVLHDKNLIGLLTTLGIEIEEFPGPTATVAIELHKKNEEYYFEVYHYSNHKQSTPTLMKMPCGTNCSYDIMIKQWQTYAEANFEEICAKDNAKSGFAAIFFSGTSEDYQESKRKQGSKLAGLGR